MSKQTINQQIENLQIAIEQKRNSEAEEILKQLAKRKTNAEQRAIIEELAQLVVSEAKQMSSQLAKHRVNYVVGLTANGDKSLHNGDPVAKFLEMKTPEEVCALADLVCDEITGWHAAKYINLNPGQRRMNAGNKIRARIKKGEFTLDQLKAA